MDEVHSLGNARAWVRRQVPLSARYPAAHGLEACPLSNVGGSTPPDKIEWESHEAGRPIPGFAALRPPGGHRACARIDACTSPPATYRPGALLEGSQGDGWMWMMWRRGPKTPGFALLLTLFATLHVATSADAASLGRQCRQVCRDEIAACVAAEGHSRACRRSTLQLCRQEGVAVCQGQAGPTSTALAGACSSPTVIPAAGGTFSGTTSGTSSQAGSCGSSGSSPERVFRWTPTVSGTATIQTCGAATNFDTILYMRSGVCSGGAEVVSGCNDDACANSSGLSRASRITPTVTAGQTYFIVVDGYGGSHGTFSLTVTPPGASATTTTLRAVTASTTSTTVTTRPPTTTTTLLHTGAPSVPAGLSASAVSCGQVNLAWSASTAGASGVRGYNVYRNGAFAKQVLAPTTSTVDIGVIQSSLYSYNVSAIDGVGNQSGMSNTVIINTPPCSSTSGGQYLWTRAFGGSTTSDEAIATATAVDSSGSVWVAGRVLGTVDFGGGPVTSRGLWD